MPKELWRVRTLVVSMPEQKRAKRVSKIILRDLTIRASLIKMQAFLNQEKYSKKSNLRRQKKKMRWIITASWGVMMLIQTIPRHLLRIYRLSYMTTFPTIQQRMVVNQKMTRA